MEPQDKLEREGVGDATHTCTTADGVLISLGLIIINNDLKPVIVTEAPREPCTKRSGINLEVRDHCWWGCYHYDGTYAGQFDGTRMVTSYYCTNQQVRFTAEELW